MPIVKVKDGLLEEYNFYLKSHFEDFIGTNAVWSRTNDEFILSFGDIKRKIDYNLGFNIIVEKDIIFNNEFSKAEFYIENNDIKIMLSEDFNDDLYKYWKIIFYDNFIQSYVSNDGIDWENKGGCTADFEGIIYQGFSCEESELKIKNYNVYASPYLKIQNFNPETKIILYDENNTIIKEGLFNNDYECNIFMNCDLKGYIKCFDDNKVIYTSPVIEFKQGDVFLFLEDYIQLIYENNLLDYKTTNINKNESIFKVKNAGENSVYDINIIVENKNTDLVEISFDNNIFSDSLFIEELKVGEEKEMYLKITKNYNESNFTVKDFEIKIY